LRITVLCVLALAIGCGGGVELVEKDLKRLRARLDDMTRSTSAIRTRIESVEDRVLLLRDEVETQKMAAMRGRTQPRPPLELPTITLAPENHDSSFPAHRSDTWSQEEAISNSVYQEIDDQGRLVTTNAPKKRKVKRPLPKPRRATRDRHADESVPLQDYRTAYELYEQGRLIEAMSSFQEFIGKHSRHAYADNAQYWVGECLYDQKDFAGAKREFMRVITDHPDGNKVPDAMVKVGLCGKNMGQHEEARRMFQTVMLTYPDSDAAAVAMRLSGELP